MGTNNTRKTTTINTFLMDIKSLKNKIGMQVAFLLHSNKDVNKTIEHITKIAIDYHNQNTELSNLEAIQEYLYKKGANDETINDKIKNFKKT